MIPNYCRNSFYYLVIQDFQFSHFNLNTKEINLTYKFIAKKTIDYNSHDKCILLA